MWDRRSSNSVPPSTVSLLIFPGPRLRDGPHQRSSDLVLLPPPPDAYLVGNPLFVLFSQTGGGSQYFLWDLYLHPHTDTVPSPLLQAPRLVSVDFGRRTRLGTVPTTAVPYDRTMQIRLPGAYKDVSFVLFVVFINTRGIHSIRAVDGQDCLVITGSQS